jgi:predicted transcriptional regulator
MEKTTFYLSGELQRSLLAVARREGRSQADIIRSALDAYLSSRTLLPLKSIGAGRDSEVSGATSEEWLRKNWKKDLKNRKRTR